jgi:hypothetical protein
VLASQWRQLAEEADWTDEIGSRPLLERIRHADVNDCRQTHNPNQQHAHALETAALLEKIDEAESPIRSLELLLKAIAEPQTPKEHQQLAHQ